MISSGAKELFENLTKNNSLKDYLASVKVRTVVGREISVDVHLHTGLINYPDNCQTLDVARKNEIKEEGVKDIRLTFRRFPPNGSMFISLLGKSSACSRNLAELAFSQTGDRIGVERNWEKHFVVKILGNKFPEEDPGNDCRNYPTEHFKSYKVCDDDFLRKEVNKISPGLKPIWIVKNLSIATSQRKYSAGLSQFSAFETDYNFVSQLQPMNGTTFQDTTRSRKKWRACTMGKRSQIVQCLATPLARTHG